MKTKYIILIIALLVIALSCFLIFRKRVEITSINSFYLTYTKGYAMNSYVRYELRYDEKEEKWIATIKPYGIEEEKKKEVIVEEEVSKTLEKILKEYHVEKWDGFEKRDKNVLDGDSFSLSVRMENDNDISASGYMMWPKNYRDVVNKVDEIFMKIYNENEE